MKWKTLTRNVYSLGKATVSGWLGHEASRMGAALAFYTLFAIAPLFLIVLTIAGFVYGEEAARNQLFDHLKGLVGPQGSEAVQAVVQAADKPKAGTWATVLAVITLFVGATGVFVQLQAALNTVWNVRRKPGRGIRHFITDRLLSFAIVLVMGFLLLVSLLLTAMLAAFGKFLSGFMPAQEALWQVVNFVVSLGVVTLLFALIFKVLPDVKIAWRDVWVGGLVTALLFNLGKFLLGLYLGRSTLASVYGAAGSLVVLLLWVYYSAQILFFGAEMTRLYASQFGSQVQAKEGSEFVAVKEVKSQVLKHKSHR